MIAMKIRKAGKWVDVGNQLKVRKNGKWVDGTATMKTSSGSQVVSQKEYTKTYEATWTRSFYGTGAYKPRIRIAKWGDTLSHYALWYNTTVSNIVAMNKPIIKSPHVIYAGDRYVIGKNNLSGTLRPSYLAQGKHNGNRFNTNYGNRRSMIGFNTAQIRKDLAGAEIVKIELRLSRRKDSVGAKTATIVIGSHNNASAPSKFSENWYGQGHVRLDKNSTKWTTLDKWFGEYLKDNRIKGITIHSKNTGNSYLADLFGMGSTSYKPMLRITYKK